MNEADRRMKSVFVHSFNHRRAETHGQTRGLISLCSLCSPEEPLLSSLQPTSVHLLADGTLISLHPSFSTLLHYSHFNTALWKLMLAETERYCLVWISNSKERAAGGPPRSPGSQSMMRSCSGDSVEELPHPLELRSWQVLGSVSQAWPRLWLRDLFLVLKKWWWSWHCWGSEPGPLHQFWTVDIFCDLGFVLVLH